MGPNPDRAPTRTEFGSTLLEPVIFGRKVRESKSISSMDSRFFPLVQGSKES